MRMLKKAREKMKVRTLRWIAMALCAVMLAVAVPVGLASRQGVTQAAPDYPQLSLSTLFTKPGVFFDTFFNAIFDGFWEAFSFLDYKALPRSSLFYNDKTAFQSIFGFNALYDRFAFTMNVYADTMRCKFTYGDRDWLIQMWKGAYAMFLCTGGEIGVYSKPTDRAVEHYDSVQEDPDSWPCMEMTIYNRGEELFTRPFDRYWWCTGYKLSYLHGFYKTPRPDCVMKARIQFQSAEMAELFADQLALKGFVKVPYLLDPDALTECYTVDEDTVGFVWRTVAE